MNMSRLRVYIYIWFRDVLVLFFTAIFHLQDFFCQNRTKPYIYIHTRRVEIFLKMFRVQDREKAVPSVVFTTRAA